MNNIKLPKYSDYNTAVQSARIAFQKDAELRVCEVDTNPHGMPNPRTGNFAYTYCLKGTKRNWAVRCFYKYIPNETHYRNICHFIETHPRNFFTPTYYIAQGIFVEGHWYPIVKMQWVEGKSLGTYLDSNVEYISKISNLLNKFTNLVSELETLGIAHGDLQHANIMVQNEDLVLVDYDGMYIPGSNYINTKERGHCNYQHPAREQEFSPHLDRFPSIVIYLALKALTRKPQLWDTYGTSENLLFQQEDFIEPDSSKLLMELESLPGFQSMIQSFRYICKTDLAQVPTLSDFLSTQITEALPENTITIKKWEQYKVIDAKQRLDLLNLVGQRITVVGKIIDCTFRTTKTGKPYVFLNFGNWRNGDFRLVIWSEGIQTFRTKGKDPQTYQGKWVSVTGLLDEYHTESWPLRPQIIIETPAEIEVLSNGEEEAIGRLSETVNVSFNKNSESEVIQTKTNQEANAQFNPSLAKEYLDEGMINYQRGELDEAIQKYQAALEIYPDYIEACRSLGDAYSKKGRLDKAQQAFQQILNINPCDVNAHFGLAWIYNQQGQLEKASNEYKIVIHTNPNDSTAHFYLGLIYDQQEQLTAAITELKIAAKLTPNDKNIQRFLNTFQCKLHEKQATEHCQRGLQFMQQQCFYEAIQEFSTTLNINPRISQAQLGLIQAYLQIGQRDAAYRQSNLARGFGIAGIDQLLENQLPRLSISNEVCIFGEVPLGQKSTKNITISNTGNKPIQVQIENIISWLTITPLQFICESNDTRIIKITIPDDLDIGIHQYKHAFQIKSDGNIMPIGIDVKIIPPILFVEPKELIIYLDKTGKGQAEIKVTNLGAGQLEGKINRPYGVKPKQLEVTPSHFICQEEQSQYIKVVLHYPILPFKVSPNYIKLNFTSNGGDATINIKPQTPNYKLF